MRRDDAPGKSCAAGSQQNQSGGLVGQQPPTQKLQTQETNAQKPATEEPKGKSPDRPARGGTIPSSWAEFGQEVENGVIKMGQPDEQMCSTAKNARRTTPVCFIGYPPMPPDVAIILPHVRAGELTFQFLAPHLHAHHSRPTTNSGHTNQNNSI